MKERLEAITEKYKDLQSLYDALPEDTRLHSVRVAEYAKALFLGAVEIELAPPDKESVELISEAYADDLYQAGLFHDIGILALDEEAKLFRPDLPLEAKEKHREHPELGVALLEHYREEEDSDISWRMMLDAVSYHHERPDGSGYPRHLKTEEIPFVAAIIAIADKLDCDTAYVHLEDPFGKGIKSIREHLLAEELDDLDLVLEVSERRLKVIFDAHRDETLAINCPPQMIFRRSNRPLQLKYRRVNYMENNQPMAFQAIPSFYDVDWKDEIAWGEMMETFREEKMLFHVWRYLLYEAGDMLRRMSAYGYDDILLQIPAPTEVLEDGFFRKTFLRWINETSISTQMFELLLDPDTMVYASKEAIETLRVLTDTGILLGLRHYTGTVRYEHFTRDLTFSHLVLDPSALDHMDASVTAKIKEAMDEKLLVIADGIDSDEYDEQLTELGFAGICGKAVGEYLTESEILSECNTDIYR